MVTNFGDAKKLHKKFLPADLLVAYAGLDLCGSHGEYIAEPDFYEELITPALKEKYGMVSGDEREKAIDEFVEFSLFGQTASKTA